MIKYVNAHGASNYVPSLLQKCEHIHSIFLWTIIFERTISLIWSILCSDSDVIAFVKLNKQVLVLKLARSFIIKQSVVHTCYLGCFHLLHCSRCQGRPDRPKRCYPWFRELNLYSGVCTLKCPSSFVQMTVERKTQSFVNELEHKSSTSAFLM